jgi:hypothetical protein
MYVASGIRLSTGVSHFRARPMVRAVLTVGELCDLAKLVERRADEAEQDGDLEHATRLSWRAAALREAAR